MNRGGIIGADWELDDRMTAYDADHVESCGLDGGKVLLRIDDTDPGVARTIESVASVVTQLADRRLMCMVEPLPYLKDPSGRAVLDPSDERLIKVVAIASGLGSSSGYTWLKIPGSDRMREVAGATSMPVLMLGGDPGADAGRTFDRWADAMLEPNVRGLVAGRALLYPHAESARGGRAPRRRHRPSVRPVRRSVMTWFHPAGTLASGDADLVVTPDTAPWTYSGLQVFTLRPGATVTVTLSEDEGVLVPLSARDVDVTVDGAGVPPRRPRRCLRRGVGLDVRARWARC